MLGFYEGFPKNVHATAYYEASASERGMQRALTQIVHKLNAEAFDLQDVTNPSVPQCTVAFEFGIADEANFNYLDEEETKKALKTIHKKTFKIMDFFCAIRYYKKKTPLKFDYYMLRFTFNRKLVEIRVFHERGPRHISPEEIGSFLVKKINEKFSRRVLKAFAAS